MPGGRGQAPGGGGQMPGNDGQMSGDGEQAPGGGEQMPGSEGQAPGDGGLELNDDRQNTSSSGQVSSASETPNINIYGGNVYINSNGDGVDSNGNITVYDGQLIVDGPASSMNGALDSGAENGGTLLIYGGTVFAGGTSAMVETFSSQSEQTSFLAMLGSGYKADSEITILDSQGTEIFHHIPASAGTSLVFSSPQLEKDGIYTLLIDDDSYEIKLTGISTRLNLRR